MNRSYVAGRFILFIIFQPKPRLVMSQSIFDKIVNHFVANYYLTPYLSPKLIDQNVATRKNYGTGYALDFVRDSLNTLIQKNRDKSIYCLKLDIKKYFYSIDHDILLDKLKRDIKDKNVIKILEAILVETNKTYVNDFVDIYNNNFNLDIPYYSFNTGLSIGAQSSQFLAIYYLNDLDHYIKEVLRCKYYLRYQDDMVIFSEDKDKLNYIWKKIIDYLKKLKLSLNKKSNIYNMKNGINFLGYNYKVINNKLVVNYNKKTYKRINNRLVFLFENDIDNYYRSYASYYGYFKYINKEIERNFKMDVKEKFNLLKEKYNNYIVIVKDKGFYISFDKDAIIIWNLLRYKYKDNGSVAFGISAYNNVIDALDRYSLNYVIVDELEEKEVLNDESDRVYTLVLQLSNINYEKFKRETELTEMFEKILKSSRDNVDDLDRYLTEKVSLIEKKLDNKEDIISES